MSEEKGPQSALKGANVPFQEEVRRALGNRGSDHSLSQQEFDGWPKSWMSNVLTYEEQQAQTHGREVTGPGDGEF